MQEQQRRAGGPRRPPVSSTLTRRPSSSIGRCSDRPVDAEPGRVVPVGVGRVGPGRSSALRVTAAICARADATSRLPYQRPRHEDRDRHRLHAAPLLGPALRRRRGAASASRCPTRTRSRGGSRCCVPSRCARASQETHSEARVLAAEPYPGAVEAVARLARGRPLHPHHLAPRHDLARRDRALAAPASSCPYDELYCSYDKVARCQEIGIDVLIDDSPDNLERALEAGITAATLLHPWNRELCETEDVICGARLGRAGAQPRAGARMTASPRCPRRRRSPGPARPPAGDRARPHGHRLGPLRAARGPGRPDARRRSSTTTGSAARSRGSSTSRPTGGALLVSNHAGALPPDASMIAKAIQEEHPRPRKLHLTVEHFFKGYPFFSMFVAKIGGVPAHPGQRAPPAPRRAAARARLPRGREGDREALQGPLPAAPLRPRRLRRGGDARRRPDRPDRRRRRRGGDADVRPGRRCSSA